MEMSCNLNWSPYLVDCMESGLGYPLPTHFSFLNRTFPDKSIAISLLWSPRVSRGPPGGGPLRVKRGFAKGHPKVTKGHPGNLEDNEGF